MMRSEGFAPTPKLVWRAASLRCSNLPFDIVDTGVGNRLPLKHEGLAVLRLFSVQQVVEALIRKPNTGSIRETSGSESPKNA
jgi:hypothetical protein